MELIDFIKENGINIILISIILFFIIVLFYIQKWKLIQPQEKLELKEIVTIETMKNNSSLDFNNIPGFDMDKGSSFCKSHNNSINELEESCNALTKDNCNITDCCVYVNNMKCSAGTIDGPRYKTDKNGNPITIDSYYYKNKCYGKNCI